MKLLKFLEYFDIDERRNPRDKDTGLLKQYVAGLTKAEKMERARDLEKRMKSNDPDVKYGEPDLYYDKTGKRKKYKRKSRYTLKYHQMFGKKTESRIYEGREKTISNKAEAAHKKLGVTKAKLKNALRKVYNRGLAAWATGRRPYVPQHAWAAARVNSFLTKGKTYYGADRDVAVQLGLLKK